MYNATFILFQNDISAYPIADDLSPGHFDWFGLRNVVKEQEKINQSNNFNLISLLFFFLRF